jgi:hypothetical protein
VYLQCENVLFDVCGRVRVLVCVLVGWRAYWACTCCDRRECVHRKCVCFGWLCVNIVVPRCQVRMTNSSDPSDALWASEEGYYRLHATSYRAILQVATGRSPVCHPSRVASLYAVNLGPPHRVLSMMGCLIVCLSSLATTPCAPSIAHTPYMLAVARTRATAVCCSLFGSHPLRV